jgi:hypothetical protein
MLSTTVLVSIQGILGQASDKFMDWKSKIKKKNLYPARN